MANAIKNNTFISQYFSYEINFFKESPIKSCLLAVSFLSLSYLVVKYLSNKKRSNQSAIHLVNNVQFKWNKYSAKLNDINYSESEVERAVKRGITQYIYDDQAKAISRIVLGYLQEHFCINTLTLDPAIKNSPSIKHSCIVHYGKHDKIISTGPVTIKNYTEHSVSLLASRGHTVLKIDQKMLRVNGEISYPLTRNQEKIWGGCMEFYSSVTDIEIRKSQEKFLVSYRGGSHSTAYTREGVLEGGSQTPNFIVSKSLSIDAVNKRKKKLLAALKLQKIDANSPVYKIDANSHLSFLQRFIYLDSTPTHQFIKGKSGVVFSFLFYTKSLISIKYQYEPSEDKEYPNRFHVYIDQKKANLSHELHFDNEDCCIVIQQRQDKYGDLFVYSWCDVNTNTSSLSSLTGLCRPHGVPNQ
ncbi:MAG: hypothetical protein AAF443_08865 [Chlamydiota bacterium]